MSQHLSLSLQENAVHIWRIDLSAATHNIGAYTAMLSMAETTRAEQITAPDRKRYYIISRALLRTLLGLYTGDAPNAIQFSYNKHGKPYLTENPLKIEFNLSHSAEIMLIAITQHHALGIDIEKTENSVNEKLVARFFHSEEQQAFSALRASERAPAFYQLWVGKEALTKAAGLSLATVLAHCVLQLHKLQQTVTLPTQPTPLPYFLQYIALAPGFTAALATRHSYPIVKWGVWDVAHAAPRFVDNFNSC